MAFTYSVKNDSPVDKAFRVHGGHKIISAGHKGEVTVTEPYADEQIEAFARDNVELVALEGGPKALGDHTVVELKALADAEQIDLGDATKKDDIIAAIELAREQKAA